jgi:hypothetical protein
LDDSGQAGLLVLNDNVLAIIRACSQSVSACSRFLPIEEAMTSISHSW